MFVRPASRMIMLWPVCFQMPTMMTASIMKRGSVSHLGPGMPTAPSSWLMTPNWLLNIVRQTTPAAAAIVTDGRK